MATDESSQARGMVALLADIATSRLADSDLVEAAGALMAEDARYNRWAYSLKGEASTADLWKLAAFAGRVQSECAQAWAHYLSELDAERAVARQALLDALRDYCSRMQVMRKTGKIDFVDPNMPAEILDL